MPYLGTTNSPDDGSKLFPLSTMMFSKGIAVSRGRGPNGDERVAKNASSVLGPETENIIFKTNKLQIYKHNLIYCSIPEWQIIWIIDFPLQQTLSVIDFQYKFQGTRWIVSLTEMI